MGRVVMKSMFFALALLTCLTNITYDGQIDTTFGNEGYVYPSLKGIQQTKSSAIFVQNDQKIILIGSVASGSYRGIMATRFYINGSMDESFNGNGANPGFATTNFGSPSYSAVAQQGTLTNDQKILIVGSVLTSSGTIGLARYDQDGELDTTLNNNGTYGPLPGTVITPCPPGNCAGQSVALQVDGKMVVVGTYADSNVFPSFIIVRYNVDGRVDESFGKSGSIIINSPEQFYQISAIGIAVQKDGKIIAIGNITQANNFGGYVVVRLLPNGQIDTAFGSQGFIVALTAEVYSLLVDRSGNILLGGQTIQSENFFMARYLSSGAIDDSFGDGGTVNTALAQGGIGIQAMALDANDKIIAFGGYINSTVSFYPTNFIVGRYYINGTLDTSFDQVSESHPGFAFAECGYDCSPTGVAIQKDNKILTTGYFYKNNTLPQISLVRFLNEDSTVDNSIN